MNTNIKRIFLGGGAFGCIYHIGVIKALYKYNIDDITIYGNSAGSWFGLFYTLRMPIKDIQYLFDTCAKNAKSNIENKPGDISSYQLTLQIFWILKQVNDKYPNAYNLCSGQLNIGVTKLGTGFEWKNTFNSNLDLFNTLLCSSNIPYLCNYEAKLDDEICIDGVYGFDVTKHLPEDTMKISLYDLPIYDINANIPFLHRFMPPEPKLCKQYVKRGYNDMKLAIRGEKLEKCESNYHNSLEKKISSEEVQAFMCKLQYVMDIKMYNYKDLKRYLATSESNLFL